MATRAHYPSISLPDAIDRVRAIYGSEGLNNMSNEVAVRHMGYSALSGTAMSTLASLKRYGLMEGRGDDLHVSQDAVVIISDENAEDQRERSESLERCLATDNIFRELLDRFGSQTTKLNVSSYLKKKGFKPNAAEKAAASFIDSVRFVDEQKQEYTSNRATESEKTNMPSGVQQVTGKHAVVAPLMINGVNTWPEIAIPENFSEKNWDDMIQFLGMVKHALITRSTGVSTIETKDEDGENL